MCKFGELIRAVTCLCLDLATPSSYRSPVGWRGRQVWEKVGRRGGKEGDVGREKREGEVGCIEKQTEEWQTSAGPQTHYDMFVVQVIMFAVPCTSSSDSF